jgi:hypothetical protein
MSCEGQEWIHVAQDKDRWWALVNTAVKLRVGWEFIDRLSYYQLLKKDATQWCYLVSGIVQYAYLPSRMSNCRWN